MSNTGTAKRSRWSLSCAFFVAALTLLTSACTTPTQPQEIVAIEGVPRQQVLPCPTGSPPRVCVDIVFIPFTIEGTSVLCPVYTLTQNGQLNGIPDLSKKVPDQRLLWRAVDVAGNRIKNVTFYVYFDPFVGRKKSKEGKFTSKKLASPPDDVQFKYTITADGGCSPLDPMIRIAN